MFNHPTHQEIDRLKFEIEKLEDCDRNRVSQVLELLSQMQSELPAIKAEPAPHVKAFIESMMLSSKFELEERKDVTSDT